MPADRAPAARARVRGLYAVTPDVGDTRRLLAMVSAALRGGAGVVQYRNKTASPALAATQAAALRALTREHGALLIVNDDIALAAACAADGVHLGRDDGSIDQIGELRRALQHQSTHPPRAVALLIGVSCYDQPDRAVAASAAGADYLAFGSFFPSSVKPLAPRPDPAILAGARHRFGLPLVAIGGITPDNAPSLIAAGADAIAVITALFGTGAIAGNSTSDSAGDPARDIERRARSFSNLYEHHV